MIWETLERVNKLRKAALEDPEFLDSARVHEEWILNQTNNKGGSNAEKRKEKKLSDIYEHTDFSINPSGSKH
ncbi:hypothetical protein [Vibrio sp. 99-70-13A1]|uniref:hypothetical protein n=1 Tax=Vibrio sp. 99-70-13A1 TaxID=2607601 RepID=UPI0014938EF0|nr:hypothetical protein [Vibrio sp. 99-70-13A1]NOH96905.1 hypothetical protein [Vibrio sp. 99-70-13A1]